MSVPAETAWYKMNDNLATTVVLDATGSHNGTASSNTENLSASGKVGNGFDFDDDADSGGPYTVTITKHADIAFVKGDAFSITWWVKSSGIFIGVFNKRTGGNGYAMQQLVSNGQILFSTDGGAIASSTGGNINAWTHFALVADTDNSVDFYRNGAAFGTSTITTLAVGDVDLTLGVDDIGNECSFVDDLRLFGAALTLEQVQAIYNDGDGSEESLASLLATGPPVGSLSLLGVGK